MRSVAARLAVLGAAVGAALFLRRYLSGAGQSPAAGEVEITLEDGSAVTPDPTTARELAEIAARVLEVGERA
jgi:hypothetical protein